jgi:hypothetical protein
MVGNWEADAEELRAQIVGVARSCLHGGGLFRLTYQVMQDTNCIVKDATIAPTVSPPTTANSITPPTTTTHITGCSTTLFLVEVGRVVLKKESQDWMDLDALYEVSKEHGVKMHGNPGRDALESALRKLFADKEEITSNGVNVVAYERRQKWEMVFMVRFYKCPPTTGQTTDALNSEASSATPLPVLSQIQI